MEQLRHTAPLHHVKQNYISFPSAEVNNNLIHTNQFGERSTVDG
jgi:hypothetical protein